MAVDGGVLEVLANERCALFLRQLVEPPGRGTEAGGGPASATWQVELAMPDAVATSAGATALELLLWRLRPAISRLQDEAAAALLSVDVQRDDVGLAISLRGRPAALPNVLRLVLATLHRAMNEEGSADERAWVLAAVALRDALVAQVAATNASALAVGGEVLKSAFLAPYFARARVSPPSTPPPATLRALLRRAAAGRLLRGVVLLIGHGGLNRMALAAHARPFLRRVWLRTWRCVGSARPPRAAASPRPAAARAATAQRRRRVPCAATPRSATMRFCTAARVNCGGGGRGCCSIAPGTTDAADCASRRVRHGPARGSRGARLGTVRRSRWRHALASMKWRRETCSHVLKSGWATRCARRAAARAFRRSALRRTAPLASARSTARRGSPPSTPRLSAEATAAAATEVAAAVDARALPPRVVEQRLSYSGFVGAAWRLFGRRALRLAVLVRGNSARVVAAPRCDARLAKLQNSNSQTQKA